MTACSSCIRPSIRAIGTRYYCDEHLLALFDSFTSPALAHVGFGILDGASVRCTSCGATWKGATGDRCGWCAQSYAIMLDHQADIVLTPPDFDVDMHDDEIERRMVAWAERLERAVEADIVTHDEAERALRRQMGHAA